MVEPKPADHVVSRTRETDRQRKWLGAPALVVGVATGCDSGRIRRPGLPRIDVYGSLDELGATSAVPALFPSTIPTNDRLAASAIHF